MFSLGANSLQNWPLETIIKRERADIGSKWNKGAEERERECVCVHEVGVGDRDVPPMAGSFSEVLLFLFFPVIWTSSCSYSWVLPLSLWLLHRSVRAEPNSQCWCPRGGLSLSPTRREGLVQVMLHWAPQHLHTQRMCQ